MGNKKKKNTTPNLLFCKNLDKKISKRLVWNIGVFGITHEGVDPANTEECDYDYAADCFYDCFCLNEAEGEYEKPND